MGTLSSLTGAGSGGGGGDPQATFQASANVANGDLVVLNDNGTVEPVTSTLNASDFAQTDSGTNLYAGGISSFSSYAAIMLHNADNDEYVSFVHDNSGNIYLRMQAWSYSDSTNQFTNLYNITTFSTYHWNVFNDNSRNQILLGYADPNGWLRIRGLFKNTSNQWELSSQSTTPNGENATNCAYVGRNEDGTIVGASKYNTNNSPYATTFSWNGTSSAPTLTGSNAASTNYNDTTGNILAVDNGGFLGTYAGNDVHVLAVRDTNASFAMKLVAFRATSGGTTWGTPVAPGINTNNNYGQIVYDSVGNVGIVSYNDGTGSAKIVGFTVNKQTLGITTFGEVERTKTIGAIGFNPTSKLFFCTTDDGANPNRIKFFTLNSSGTKGATSEEDMLPSYSASSMSPERGGMSPRTNSGNMIFAFNASDPVSGSYITSSNNTYATQFSGEYVDTNIDSHFGEAKEAITSGNAGPVGILNRTVDVTGASFQKGQKLFANPSGSALATSGTYRVGYATDTDTILVTGDPS
jgi:hypothetical protein